MSGEKPHICVFHGERNEKIKDLEAIVRDLPKAHMRMNMKINIGYGIFLAGALIVGIVFTQLDTVKADMSEKQTLHEVRISEEQSELKHKIEGIESKVGSIEVTTAVISAQIKNYQEDLREDREATRQTLAELRELLTDHGDRLP